MRIYTKKSEQAKRRILRSNMTKAEVILWFELKNKKLVVRFLRQFSIGKYVIDFYCPKLKLAIEIDGYTHLLKEEIEYDRIRQTEIEVLGVKFLRFTNEQIKCKLTNVIKEVNKKIIEIKMHNSPASPSIP